MFSLRRVLFLVRKERRQLGRDPMILRMMLIAPVLQLAIYGYAVTTDLHDVPVAVVDRDQSSASREMVDEIARVGTFQVRYLGLDPQGLVDALDRGQVVLGMDIPEGFSRSLARGEQAPLQVLADGSDSNYSLLALSYLAGDIASQGFALQTHYRERHFPGPAETLGLRLEPRIWYNPELRSVNYMVPGIMGLILLTMAANLTALSIVREREIGTLEQLSVSPLEGMDLMVGKMVVPAAIAMIDAILIVSLARVWFQVPVQGSLVLLFALSAGFLPAALGGGLLISTVTRNQQQAQIANFFFTLPSVLLSGLAFPIANMPPWAQMVTYAIPLRYYLVITRGIFLKGSGLQVLWPQVAALLGIGMGTLLLGALLFRKRLD